jgi:hypothetical protein
MNRARYLPLVLLCCLTACRHTAAPQQSKDPIAPATASSTPSTIEPPSAKEILRALLSSSDVSLRVDPSCAGVGSEFSDATIGDYVAGLMAQHAQRSGTNWIEVASDPQPGGKPVRFWNCRVVFHRIDGEERGGWGVTFLMRASDHHVVNDSFRCTGGG